MISIYAILDAETREVLYIGQSDNPRARFNMHTCRTGKFCDIKDKITWRVLFVVSPELANELERATYDWFKKRGQCRMNGKRYCHYYARTAERMARDMQTVEA